MSKKIAPEFSFVLAVDKIPAGGMEVTLKAREPECRALAERFGLLDITKLQAELSVNRQSNDDTIAVSGPMRAEIIQSCVVTLEPLSAIIDKRIETLYVPPNLVDPDNENIEALENGLIDLGELVAQHLGTGLDPYPRKPGLSFVEAEYGESVKPENPFAKLVLKKE